MDIGRERPFSKEFNYLRGTSLCLVPPDTILMKRTIFLAHTYDSLSRMPQTRFGLAIASSTTSFLILIPWAGSTLLHPRTPYRQRLSLPMSRILSFKTQKSRNFLVMFETAAGSSSLALFAGAQMDKDSPSFESRALPTEWRMADKPVICTFCSNQSPSL